MNGGSARVGFHIRDAGLGTLRSCVSRWTNFSEDIPRFTVMNFFTGAPQADAFSLSESCPYDDHSRLVASPLPEAYINGVGSQISVDPVALADTEEFFLPYDIEVGDSLQVRYYFEIADAYPAAAKRARVSSLSDAAGEWFAISEVVSAANSAPSAMSGLFRGEAAVSVSVPALIQGDGRVWMRRAGETLTIAYFGADGAMKASSSAAIGDDPTPTPTPTPRPTSTPTPTPTPDGPPRSVALEFADIPTQSGGTASFYIADNRLGTTIPCRAVWTGISADIQANADWNLVTGAPHPDAFTLEGCDYDGGAPLALHPRPKAFVDGAQRQIYPDSELPTFRFLYSVIGANRVEVRFHYEVADAYPAQSRRARVYSWADHTGEWVDIKEVASKTDDSPSAASYLYRGEVALSGDSGAAAAGDGKVRIRYGGETITLMYYNADGSVEASVRSPVGYIPTPTRTPTATPQPHQPERSIQAEFAAAPSRSGDVAVFHIADNYLGSTTPCRAVWTDISADIPANAVWSLASGEPQPEAFALRCDYGGAPIALYPRMRAFVNGLEYFLNPDPGSGAFSLQNDVSAGSSVAAHFHYEMVDAYPAQERRARVYSSSDAAGEWVAIREVASRTDDSPAAASYLYRGQVVVSAAAASLAAGDGKVRVRESSRLSLRYYAADGRTEFGGDSVSLALPTPTALPTRAPTPTPVPAVGLPALLVAAAAFAAALTLMRRRAGPN